MKAICLIVCALPLLGQALQIVGETGSPGEPVSLNIVLASPGGKEPVALQWETTFSAEHLTLLGTPLIGYTAHTAGKALACAEVGDKQSQGHAYRCILAGGNKAVANGPVATLTFKISSQAPEKVRIQIQHAMSVSAGLKKTDIQDTEGFVTVRR